jgi:small subunit ribosomal protein S21
LRNCRRTNAEDLPGELAPRHHPQGENMQVIVRDNNVEQALRALKKKMQREGLFREMKERRAYEKPSERRVREKAQAIARQRKAARKKMQREGLLPTARRRASVR